jgi:hypothetical protein
MILLQLCAIAGVLLQFWCNSGAILVQLQLRLGETCCDLGRLKISNAYRYWPGAEWKGDRAPPATNQGGKNTRRKDAWRKLAQWPGRSDWAVSHFPNFQHRLSHALNIPHCSGGCKSFLRKNLEKSQNGDCCQSGAKDRRTPVQLYGNAGLTPF